MTTTTPGAAMHTLILTPSDALLMAKAALANVSREDITPVVCGAHFALVDGRLEVLATDRYTVSRHYLPLQKVADRQLVPEKARGDLSAIVPRPALQWLVKHARAFSGRAGNGYGGKVVLELHPVKDEPQVGKVREAGYLTLTVAPLMGEHEALSATFPLIAGNYPPLGRLIDEAKPAAAEVLALDPRKLARIAACVPEHVGVRVEFTEGKNGQAGPIKWTCKDLDLEGLVQPNFLLPR